MWAGSHNDRRNGDENYSDCLLWIGFVQFGSCRLARADVYRELDINNPPETAEGWIGLDPNASGRLPHWLKHTAGKKQQPYFAVAWIQANWIASVGAGRKTRTTLSFVSPLFVAAAVGYWIRLDQVGCHILG